VSRLDDNIKTDLKETGSEDLAHSQASSGNERLDAITAIRIISNIFLASIVSGPIPVAESSKVQTILGNELRFKSRPSYDRSPAFSATSYESKILTTDQYPTLGILPD
jgi:hypothetical protein